METRRTFDGGLTNRWSSRGQVTGMVPRPWDTTPGAGMPPVVPGKQVRRREGVQLQPLAEGDGRAAPGREKKKPSSKTK